MIEVANFISRLLAQKLVWKKGGLLSEKWILKQNLFIWIFHCYKYKMLEVFEAKLLASLSVYLLMVQLGTYLPDEGQPLDLINAKRLVLKIANRQTLLISNEHITYQLMI